MDITNMKKAEAMEALIRDGYSFKDAEAYWKENGSASRGGYMEDFYSVLEDGPMDEAKLDEWLSDKSDNAKKHRSLLNNIRVMANNIWKNA